MYYYPLLKNANNEMKAIKELNEITRQQIIPIIESKRIKKENLINWESSFKTLGKYLKERIMDTNFIFDFNCAFEELGEVEELKDSDGNNLVEHCLSKMSEQKLNVVPCFQHDSPEWLIRSVINSGLNKVAIRIRCHDFQESFNPFVVQKLQNDLAESDQELTIILDFFEKETTTKRIQKAIDDFSKINFSNMVYLSTSCPENANEAAPHSLTQIKPRTEWNNFIELRKTNKFLQFGDYTTRLKGEILKGFNHYNSYIKIFYSTETHYWIAKSELIGNDGELSFHEVCQELIEQDFYPGSDFSFGDKMIYECALKKVTIADHQKPIAIGVNHHIETTVTQLSDSPIFSSL